MKITSDITKIGNQNFPLDNLIREIENVIYLFDKDDPEYTHKFLENLASIRRLCLGIRSLKKEQTDDKIPHEKLKALFDKYSETLK